MSTITIKDLREEVTRLKAQLAAAEKVLWMLENNPQADPAELVALMRAAWRRTKEGA